MFGISGENVVEHVVGEDGTPTVDDGETVTIVYNRTDPSVTSDGVDHVSVLEEGDDRYLVDYRGHETGHLRVTREGVGELGETLLGTGGEIPKWLVKPPLASEARPRWIPADYDGEPTVPCHRCGTDTPAGRILTPGTLDDGPTDRFCRGCWEAVRDGGDPEVGRTEPRSVDRARTLHRRAKTDPETVDLEEVDRLVGAGEADARMAALRSLDEIAAHRPAEVLDLLPTLTDRLGSDELLVRTGAIHCLATLADAHPRKATPAADRVVRLLDPETDEGVLEGAIPFVAAVAEADPGTVLDAVPKLAGLFRSEAPHEEETLVALAHIAASYPESVLPVTGELLTYVEADDSSHRVAAIAALGTVAKEYPNVARPLIPTLGDLLHADPHKLRANAAGLLAELCDEYPAAVRPVGDRAIELLGDEDEKIRYNATSILARLAEVYPDELAPAVEPLVGALDEDFPYTRSNACWALGHLAADSALEALEELERSDPEPEVRTAAGWALGRLG